MSSEPKAQGFLTLRDRAYAFVAARGEVSEEALLTHVYGGSPPQALRARLVSPLLDDPRLERRADGGWAAIGKRPPNPHTRLSQLALTTLALAASGPSPSRGRVVRVAALHVQNGQTLERFTATVNPDGRVPRYVADRLGLATELLDELPPFEDILDDLVRFLGARPVFAQDARLTWAFISAEARRAGRVLAEPLLVDANEIATRLLTLKGKPTLALVAAHLGIGTVRITRPEEEARVLAAVAQPLLALADARADPRVSAAANLDALIGTPANQTQGQRIETKALRRGQTAQSQPDEPGVYVMRDVEQAALYVGKASSLRSRLAAYVHRPLGATRRLEGLVESVTALDSTVCATDLEALVLEDREIRRLQPRYNTARDGRTPRVWIRLPPLPASPPVGKRQPAARRLELSLGPDSAPGEFVGPFRNQTIAEQTRLLARTVFDLDALRQGDRTRYEERLAFAWAFVQSGDRSGAAATFARQRSTRVVHAVLAYEPAALVLPADPRVATYVVVRPGQAGIEGFRIERATFRGWSVLGDEDVHQFALDLLAVCEPRTAPEDVDVVLRWFGAQRPPARLVHLPEDPLAAADAIELAALALADSVRHT